MLAMSYRKLKVWEKAMELVKIVYELTSTFPKEEQYGLVSQMRRSAISLPSNIAEGSQRTSNKEFANFILIAKGSLAELETQVLTAQMLRYGSENHIEDILRRSDELSRMLHVFHSKLVTHNS
ncbi:MAG: four helix bundle protein [Candidatus Peribacteraceae bacterium]|nr:four helix bundle protein [Candidatus Peribacteraceae bacterium]MDD5739335.1 four helix bundle protein [Candidatus Peribacteraceae bacterium]